MKTQVRMKRVCILFAVLLLALLCSCGEQEEMDTVYEVNYNGKDYTVDLIEQTISFYDVVCRYEIIDGTCFQVTYPDGSTWTRDMSANKVEISWSDDYDASRYVSGDSLWDVLGRRTEPEGAHGERTIVGSVLLAAGLLYALSPKTGWKLNHGLSYKEAEPTERSLMVNRMFGFAGIAGGLVCIFM